MAAYRYTFKKFINDWMLIIGMVAGASAYLIYHATPALHPAGPFLLSFCKHIQPVLLNYVVNYNQTVHIYSL